MLVARPPPPDGHPVLTAVPGKNTFPFGKRVPRTSKMCGIKLLMESNPV